MGTEEPDGREKSNMEKGVPSQKEIPRAEAADLLTGALPAPLGRCRRGRRGRQLLETVVITDLKPMGRKRGVVGDARLWSQTDLSPHPHGCLSTWRSLPIHKVLTFKFRIVPTLSDFTVMHGHGA